MAQRYAAFKGGVLVGSGHLKKTLTEIKAIKEVNGVVALAVTDQELELINAGCPTTESGGVVTIIKSAEWLENKNNEAWKKIRKERNQLLKDSDYIMVSDAPITTEKKEEWETYRQSLRDIPQTFSNPDDVTYPDKPE
jgi:hypothetical protein